VTVRALPLLVAALLGVGAAFLVACGERNGLIPASDAARITSDLSAVSSAVAAGNCDAAGVAATRVRGDILKLPGTVDPKLVNRLNDGAGALSARAPVQCTQAQTQPTAPTGTTATTQTDTTTTDTTTTDTTTTDTTPTDTTTTDTTTTGTAPTDTTTTPTTPTTPTGTTQGGGTGGASPGTTGGTG
jgi:hypothetical protein